MLARLGPAMDIDGATADGADTAVAMSGTRVAASIRGRFVMSIAGVSLVTKQTKCVQPFCCRLCQRLALNRTSFDVS